MPPAFLVYDSRGGQRRLSRLAETVAHEKVIDRSGWPNKQG